MKTSFKKFMGVDAPKVPKPLPEPREPHLVPKGYKRVRDGSFNKLVKESRKPGEFAAIVKGLNNIASDAAGYQEEYFGANDTKHDIITVLLHAFKEGAFSDNVPNDDIGIDADTLLDMISYLRENGYDWPELTTIEKSTKKLRNL